MIIHIIGMERSKSKSFNTFQKIINGANTKRENQRKKSQQAESEAINAIKAVSDFFDKTDINQLLQDVKEDSKSAKQLVEAFNKLKDLYGITNQGGQGIKTDNNTEIQQKPKKKKTKRN